ncbi:hypothetical protein HN358_02940 [Candidatus Uhrbacteria bacterium]|jgi:DNA-directed RNA polymerase alpha subunit|nr:hypothetical protein [Candidatus Uhrbacteria bacterium]MBT7717157.1 hypothetical protein [Candidatus Uhrbacteria bacterium]
MSEPATTRQELIIKILRLEADNARLQAELETAKIRIQELEAEHAPEMCAEYDICTLSKPIEELVLSKRVKKLLRFGFYDMPDGSMVYIWQLIEKTEAEVLHIRGLGRKSFGQIKVELAELGLSLGMGCPDEIKAQLPHPDFSAKMIENLSRTWDDIELSIRAANCFNLHSIWYVWEFVEYTDKRALAEIKNFGRGTLNELKEILEELGLELNTKIPLEVRTRLPQDNPYLRH